MPGGDKKAWPVGGAWEEGSDTVKHTITTNITQHKAKQEQIPKCVVQGQREHMGSVGGA